MYKFFCVVCKKYMMFTDENADFEVQDNENIYLLCPVCGSPIAHGSIINFEEMHEEQS